MTQNKPGHIGNSFKSHDWVKSTSRDHFKPVRKTVAAALEAPWALGALDPKKWLKRPDGGLGSGGKGAENSPPGPPFSAT
jgi:hypothetical protein